MDVTTKKIAQLIGPEHDAAMRQAAVRVLGEVADAEKPIAAALCAALDDADPGVRLAAIQAIGKLKVAETLPKLLSRIERGGEEAQEAARSAARLGVKGAKALQDLMHKVAPGLRRYIASALGSAGTSSGDTAALEFLLDKDPGVVESAARSLIGQVPMLTTAKKQSLTEQLIHHLKDAKTGLSSGSEAAAVRVLAALGDERAEAVFWNRSSAPHAVEVRIASLQALGGMDLKPGKDQLQRLFASARESDFRVIAPTLLILKHQLATEKTVGDWMALLSAPDVAVRRFALEKLEGRDSPALAEILVGQLGHPDRSYRDVVLHRITSMDEGQKALQAELLHAATPDSAWTLARTLIPFRDRFTKAVFEKVFAQACKHHEAADRRAEPLFFFLRETDATGLRDRLLDKAVALRKKEAYEAALGFLKLLARDPAIGYPIRLELACCSLKMSNKGLSHEFRAADPCLHHFGHLIQGYEADLMKSLEKTTWLEAEDLFYLGFHFAEKDGPARKFGGHVLQLLLKRSPKSKLAKDARTKLKATGL